jgi:hypothetical protein
MLLEVPKENVSDSDERLRKVRVSAALLLSKRHSHLQLWIVQAIPC